MTNEKEMTALSPSVGAEERQSSNVTTDSITDFPGEFNPCLEMPELIEGKYLKTVSMSELYDSVYQSRPPVIDGLLYSGVYLFAGAPKLGKSFLMAQLGYHVSTGTPLWNYTVKQGTVLYLALEDDYGRLQRRLYQMFGTDSTENLHFSVAADAVDKGLDEELSNFLREHPDTRLVIIDTLQKIRESGGEGYSYASDYEIITRLKTFADSNGICLILVHHTRKQQAEDKFDMISGTNGLLGAADGAFVLQKKERTGNTATLEISGRDQQDQRLYLTRDPERLVWNLERVEAELWKAPADPFLEQVAAILTSDHPEWSGSATELTDLLGEPIQPNILTRKLNVKAGELLEQYGVEYKSKRTSGGSFLSLRLLRGVTIGDDSDG